MKRLHVQYFALLREQRGAGEETCETTANNPVDLYNELRARHSFSLPPERVRAAINDEFAAPSAPLNDGDRVAFLPPVAGG
ncbi:MAG TPA: MoaD/ThiS family protein [Opitutaceae bacterium]|jgi:molybdopterin converting factor small subunit